MNRVNRDADTASSDGASPSGIGLDAAAQSQTKHARVGLPDWGDSVTDRRRLILTLATVVIAGARVHAHAQQSARVWRIGFLGNSAVTDPAAARIYEAFTLALQERGYVEGKNLIVERRFADGRDERFPALASELVRLKLDAIITTTTPGAQALQTATSTLPIVMAGVADPVGRGLARSLSHPGGNITGLANLQIDLYSKRVELLKSVAPNVTRIVSIGNTAGLEPAKIAATRKEQDANAKAIGLSLVRIELNAPSEWSTVAAATLRERPQGLVLSPTPINFKMRREIAEFATTQRLPTIGANRDQAVAGILMSYGPNNDDILRRAAEYMDKILKGASPGDLPIEQPTRFSLVINMKTAKALGLAIPESLLLQADEVVQ